MGRREAGFWADEAAKGRRGWYFSWMGAWRGEEKAPRAWYDECALFEGEAGGFAAIWLALCLGGSPASS